MVGILERMCECEMQLERNKEKESKEKEPAEEMRKKIMESFGEARKRQSKENEELVTLIDISYTLDSLSVYQKVKLKISAVSSHNNRRRPYWSFPLIKKMLQKTLYFSAFVN